MKDIHKFSEETKSVHAGIGKYEFHPVVPPIYQTSTFAFEDVQHGADLFAGKCSGYIYTRMLNPTVQAFEDAAAALESGYKGLACGSGMAATHLIFSAVLSAGSHVICSEAVYGPTTTLLSTVFSRFGVEYDFVDTSDLKAVENAVRENTKLIYVETPGNPTLVISDIAEIAKIAKNAGAKLAVDNTFMSPVLQNPLLLGADMVMHSLTKFMNGHADVVGGVVVAKDEADYQLLRKTLNHTGGVLDPFNSFLVHRGLKTLKIRMDQHCKNAQKIAEFLESHSKVEWVRYPGLKSHPQHEIAKKQTCGYGGMVTFELKGGLDAGKLMMNSVHLAQLAVSLGGVETLIQHPASMTHAGMGAEQRKKSGISDGLVRLSIGIENVDDIIKDLETALNKI